ncbi:hypothetical protein Tco_0506970, partial [Tanacetum coccineum]
SSGRVDPARALQNASTVNPCCTFIAGGLPSAYKIHLHASVGTVLFFSSGGTDDYYDSEEIKKDSPESKGCKGARRVVQIKQ